MYHQIISIVFSHFFHHGIRYGASDRSTHAGQWQTKSIAVKLRVIPRKPKGLPKNLLDRLTLPACILCLSCPLSNEPWERHLLLVDSKMNHSDYFNPEESVFSHPSRRLTRSLSLTPWVPQAFCRESLKNLEPKPGRDWATSFKRSLQPMAVTLLELSFSCRSLPRMGAFNFVYLVVLSFVSFELRPFLRIINFLSVLLLLTRFTLCNMFLFDLAVLSFHQPF